MDKAGIKAFAVFFCFLTLMGCPSGSPKKKYTLQKKQVVNRFVTTNYNSAVDILFIIDDSDSMKTEQDLLAKNAEVFINQFLGVKFVDYRIAVTTSSVEDYNSNSVAYNGELHSCEKLAEKNNYNYPNYVDRNTPEAVECFKEMVKVGVRGNLEEQFLVIPDMALSLQSEYRKENSKFYRPEAHLAVFAITDSDDNSEFTPKESYTFLKALKKGDEKKLHYALGSVVIELHQYRCEREPGYGFPPKLMGMVELLGPRGYLFNLCQFNYGKNLAEFASHLVDSVSTISLDYWPDLDTIEVRYKYKGGSQVIPRGSEGWTYNVENNVIHLSRDIHLSRAGGKFNVKYEHFYTFESDQRVAF